MKWIMNKKFKNETRKRKRVKILIKKVGIEIALNKVNEDEKE